VVFVNAASEEQAHANTRLGNNLICTSKYTVLSFLPLNLMSQFQKAANVYFLLISGLQMIRQISISDGVPIMLLPLGFVIAVSMLKDAVEDYKRHVNDASENEQKKARVFRQGRFQETMWKDVHVGEVLRVESEEFIPADLVILKSSDSAGTCYVETKNLDGETNLKIKTAHKNLQPLVELEEHISRVTGKLSCEKPNNAIYKFEGSFGLESPSQQELALSAENLLLRGSSLRNTEFVYGVAVFTGKDTKIMQNSAHAKYKFSELEKNTNKAILIVLVTQLLLSLIAGFLGFLWEAENGADSYLNSAFSSPQQSEVPFLAFFGTWVLIFTNLVPISLMVSLETVKFAQAIFIGYDASMYDPE
jgi:phospholipid-transporting ATPase